MANKILVGSNFTGFKNRIINGDLSVWLEGTSFTLAANTSTTYTSEMFSTYNNTDGQFIVSKSILNGNNAIRFTVDAVPTDLTLGNYFNGLGYRFEGQHLYDVASKGKKVTISFWFNSNIAGEYAVAFRNFTDSTVNIQSYVTSFNYTTANTPQKIEITIPLDATWNPALENDNNIGLTLTIGFLNQGDYVSSANNTWIDGNFVTTSTAVNWGTTAGNFIEIAELQLEEGNTATEFEYVPYDIQLLRCMRYFEKLNIDLIGSHPGANNGYVWWMYKVPKRVTPTLNLILDATYPATVVGSNIEGFKAYCTGYHAILRAGSKANARL